MGPALDCGPLLCANNAGTCRCTLRPTEGGVWGSSTTCWDTKAERPRPTPVPPPGHVLHSHSMPMEHCCVQVGRGHSHPAVPLSDLPLKLSRHDVQLYTHWETITAKRCERCGVNVEGQHAGLFAQAVPFVWNVLLLLTQKTSPHPVRPGSNTTLWSHCIGLTTLPR